MRVDLSLEFIFLGGFVYFRISQQQFLALIPPWNLRLLQAIAVGVEATDDFTNDDGRVKGKWECMTEYQRYLNFFISEKATLSPTCYDAIVMYIRRTLAPTFTLTLSLTIYDVYVPYVILLCYWIRVLRAWSPQSSSLRVRTYPVGYFLRLPIIITTTMPTTTTTVTKTIVCIYVDGSMPRLVAIKATKATYLLTPH